MSDDTRARAILEEAIDAVLAETQPHAMLAWLRDHGYPPAATMLEEYRGPNGILAEVVLRAALDQARLLYGEAGAETPVGILSERDHAAVVADGVARAYRRGGRRTG